MEQGKTDSELKAKITELAYSFRQSLRRQNKKMKRKDSIGSKVI
jgi:hypothetical protein